MRVVRWKNITRAEFDEMRTCLMCVGKRIMCEHCENMDSFELSEEGKYLLDNIDRLIGQKMGVVK